MLLHQFQLIIGICQTCSVCLVIFPLARILTCKQGRFFRLIHKRIYLWYQTDLRQVNACYVSASADFCDLLGSRALPVEPVSNLCRTWDSPVSKQRQASPEPDPNITRTRLEHDSNTTRTRLEQKSNFPEQLQGFLEHDSNKTTFFPNKTAYRTALLSLF